MTNKQILVLNAGSSSLKFGVFEQSTSDDEPLPVCAGQIERIGQVARFTASSNSKTEGSNGETVEQINSHEDALTFLFEWLQNHGHPIASLGAIGHRIVHGGADFSAPVIITKKNLAKLVELISLAPHHMPHNIGAIEFVAKKIPDLPQIACFDTAFHATLPALETRTSLPSDYWERGIRRYGFHGLNYQHILHELQILTGKPLPERLLIAHLGNGASMCAVLAGRSVSTTMGFSTIDGLIMGTRSGNIDPGILLHLMRTKECDVECLEDLLYNKSGLLGLSELSGDMRVLLEEKSKQAEFAIEKYCYAAAQQAAPLIARLGGVDAIVFTGGIGENAARVRAGILDHFKWLEVYYDEKANNMNQVKLTDTNSSTDIWIIPANEESMIARLTLALLETSPGRLKLDS